MTLTSQTAQLPDQSGVYLFKDTLGTIIYIGKAKNLKKRVQSYFQKGELLPKTQTLVKRIDSLETIPVNSEFEALLLEAELIRKHKPRYNVIWKDDKHYIYIRITCEDFPKVLYSRKRDNNKDSFFGPYPSSKTVKAIIILLRRIFPFCTQKRIGSRACFYNNLQLCNPCPSMIVKLPQVEYKTEKHRYRQNIAFLKKVLQGQFNRLTKDLNKKMNHYAKEQKYEEAALIKNKIEKLEYLLSTYQTPDNYIRNPDSINQIREREQKNLKEILIAYYPDISSPQRIECYDISNISGKFAAGSLVTFINAEPSKNYYRRFRIKLKSSPDDFFMLREIFMRRLHHSDWELPDLFVVDGGIPQVATMKKILIEQNIPTPIIGLAKREEQIIVPLKDKFITLTLDRGTKALTLIQRLRDEAHRFAHRYHEYLRLKYLVTSN